MGAAADSRDAAANLLQLTQTCSKSTISSLLVLHSTNRDHHMKALTLLSPLGIHSASKSTLLSIDSAGEGVGMAATAPIWTPIRAF